MSAKISKESVQNTLLSISYDMQGKPQAQSLLSKLHDKQKTQNQLPQNTSPNQVAPVAVSRIQPSTVVIPFTNTVQLAPIRNAATNQQPTEGKSWTSNLVSRPSFPRFNDYAMHTSGQGGFGQGLQKNIFRSIEGKEWNRDLRMWTFPIEQHLNVQKVLCERYFKVQNRSISPASFKLSILPSWVIRVFSQQNQDNKNVSSKIGLTKNVLSPNPQSTNISLSPSSEINQGQKYPLSKISQSTSQSTQQQQSQSSIHSNSNSQSSSNQSIHQHPPTAEEEQQLQLIPVALRSALFPFQKEGVIYAIRRQGRVLIGDEMGLGKTLQALAISCAYPEDWPLIVICPSTLRFHWADEIERWCGREMCPPGSVKAVLSSKDILTGKERAVVITYELCVRMINDVTRMKFNIAISDESHYLKNWKSKRAKMIFPVIRSCNRLLLLTGTPAINRPIELFTQLHTLRPDIFSTVSEFSNRYCGAQKKAAWTDMSGATNLTELHLLIGETVMIRRLKREVLKQLPPKRRMAVFLDVGTVNTKKLMSQVKKAFALPKKRKNIPIKIKINDNYGEGQLQEGNIFQQWQDNENEKQKDKDNADEEEEENGSQRQQQTTVLQAYVAAGLAKIGAVKEFIQDLMVSGHKFLVFAHHRAVLDGICEVFENDDDYIRIDGETPATSRHILVQYFQTSPRCKVAVLSLQAASTGLSLTEASQVVFAELCWTPGVLVQAEDRVHRIGQFNPVVCTYLLAKGSIDEVIWRMIARKLEVIGQTLNGVTERINADTSERKFTKKKKNNKDIQKEKEVQDEDEDEDDEEDELNDKSDIATFLGINVNKSNINIGNKPDKLSGSTLIQPKHDSQSIISQFFKPILADIPDPNMSSEAEIVFEEEIEEEFEVNNNNKQNKKQDGKQDGFGIQIEKGDNFDDFDDDEFEDKKDQSSSSSSQSLIMLHKPVVPMKQITPENMHEFMSTKQRGKKKQKDIQIDDILQDADTNIGVNDLNKKNKPPQKDKLKKEQKQQKKKKNITATQILIRTGEAFDLALDQSDNDKDDIQSDDDDDVIHEKKEKKKEKKRKVNKRQRLRLNSSDEDEEKEKDQTDVDSKEKNQIVDISNESSNNEIVISSDESFHSFIDNDEKTQNNSTKRNLRKNVKDEEQSNDIDSYDNDNDYNIEEEEDDDFGLEDLLELDNKGRVKQQKDKKKIKQNKSTLEKDQSDEEPPDANIQYNNTNSLQIDENQNIVDDENIYDMNLDFFGNDFKTTSVERKYKTAQEFDDEDDQIENNENFNYQMMQGDEFDQELDLDPEIITPIQKLKRKHCDDNTSNGNCNEQIEFDE